MFGGYDKKLMPIVFSHDPGADDDIVVFQARQKMTITGASWTNSNAVAANTANYFNIALYNGGTAGTAEVAMSGTVGGTAGWAAKTPVEIDITEGEVEEDEVVYLRYNEEGTGTFGHAILTLQYVFGEG